MGPPIRIRHCTKCRGWQYWATMTTAGLMASVLAEASANNLMVTDRLGPKSIGCQVTIGTTSFRRRGLKLSGWIKTVTATDTLVGKAEPNLDVEITKPF